MIATDRGLMVDRGDRVLFATGHVLLYEGNYGGAVMKYRLGCIFIVISFLSSMPTLAAVPDDFVPAGWLRGDTTVSRMAPEERRAMLGVPLETLAGGVYLDDDDGMDGYLDWRDHGGDFTTPVRNQKMCGSCVAFGVIAAFESRLEIAHAAPNWNPDLSEQHLFSCGGGSCTSGWTAGPALNYCQNSGVPDEECSPYKAKDNNCNESCADWRQRALKLNSWSWVCQIFISTSKIKNALQSGPVTTSMMVYEDFYDYSGGVYSHQSGGLEGGHEICIVGFDDTLDCWIVKNSWGPGWGENGFFRIKRGNSSIGMYTASVNYTAPPSSPTPAGTPEPTIPPFPTTTPSAPATATPDIPVFPTMNPMPTPPAGNMLAIATSQVQYRAGDPFLCWIEYLHPGPEATVIQVVVLDAFGNYFFWPDWRRDLDFETRVLPADAAGMETILEFTWPEGAGASLGFLNFFSIFLDPRSWEPASNLATCQFAYS